MSFSTPPAPSAQAPQTLLAFDPGAKRTGVAVGNTLLRQAQPLAVVPSVQIFTALEKWMSEWQPQGFVVGLPSNNVGQATHGTALALKLGAQLQRRFKLPVYWVDERYSSTAAQAALMDETRSKMPGKMRPQQTQRATGSARSTGSGTAVSAAVDALAAAIILQQFFDESDA